MLQTELSTKGQVLIPLAIRDELRLEVGACFEIEIEGNHIILRPVDCVDPIDYLYGIFAGEGMLDDLEAEHAAELEEDGK